MITVGTLALLAWLIGYAGLPFRTPECGFATPAFRVANPVDSNLFFDLPHSRGATTFNFAHAQMAGCTPVSVVDSSLPDAACSWAGDESTFQYEGLSRLPARKQYYDSPGVLFADSPTTYTFRNGLLVGLAYSCEGGFSCAAQGFRYTYNALGQMTLEEELYPGSTSATYSYDASGRISTVVSGANTVSYTYDAAGRLTQMTESSPALTLSLSY